MRVEDKLDIPPPSEANLPSVWRDLSQDDVRTLLSHDPKPAGSSAAKTFADVIYRLGVKTAADKVKEGSGKNDPVDPKRKERSKADVKKAWFEAVKEGDVEKVKQFTRDQPKGWSVDMIDDAGGTALHLALRKHVKGDAAEMTKLLIGEGRADLTALDEHGRSPYNLGKELVERPGLTDHPNMRESGKRLYGKQMEAVKEAMNDESKLAVFNGDTARKDKLIAAGADDPLNIGDAPKQEPTERVEEFKRLDELSLGDRETSEELDGKKLTVDQLATKTLLEKYKAGIDKKEIKEDDPRYKFYYATLARSDTEGGRPIATFYEEKNGAGTTRRPGPTVDSRPEDMKGLYDTGRLEEVMNEAFKSKEVSGDFLKAQDDALGRVPGLDEEDAKKRLKEMLLGEDFKNHLLTLQSDGRQAEAEAALQRGLGSYDLVASDEEVQEVTSTIGTIGLADQVDHYLANLDRIDSEHWEHAVKDWAGMALTMSTQAQSATQSGLGVVKDMESKEWLQKILKDSAARKELAPVLKEFAKDPAFLTKPGGTPTAYNAWEKALDRAYEKAKTPLADRNAITKGLSELSKAGALGTSMGLISLGATIRQMTGGTAFGDDHMVNLGIAQGLMFTISCVPEMAQLLEKGSRYTGLSKLLRMGNSAAILAAPSLQETFKVDPKDVWTKEISERLGKNPNPIAVDPKYANTKWYNGWANRLSDQLGGNANDLGKKAAASTLKVVGGPAFAGFGLALIGSGVLTARGGADEGSTYKTAQGALQVVAGTAWTGAGTAGALEVAGRQGAGAWARGLTFAGVGPAFLAQIMGVLAEEEKPSLEQHKYLKTMEKLGVLQEGWGDKMDFLIKSFENTNDQDGDGGRPKTADGQSVFDAYDWQGWRDAWAKSNKGNWDEPRYPDLKHFARGNGEAA